MSTLKAYDDTSSLYLRIDPIYTYEEAIKRFDSHKLISNSIKKDFLRKLNNHAKKHNKNYKKKKNIFLNDIYLYLPEEYNLDYLAGHIIRFVRESLNGLPYFAYVSMNDKNIKELHIVVSERTYSCKEKVVNVYEEHDVYVNPRTDAKGMKYCKKDDEGAVLQRKKGDLKKSYSTHFSFKSRLFSGNKKAFKRFTNNLKQRWISYFRPLGIVKEHNFIQGISVKRARFRKNKVAKINWFWLRNINLFNDTKTIINDDLTVLFDMLHNIGFSEGDYEYLRAWGLANKYKMLFNSQRGIYLWRCDQVEEYFEEIVSTWKNDYNILLEIITSI